jgi:ATP-dependent protease HslVU (ClpYQ) ATPase subunit
MVRDLVELAVNMVREERIEDVRAKAELNTEERLLDLLLPPRPAAPDEDPGACATKWAARGSGCASSCATASSTTAWSKSTSRKNRSRRSS